MASIVDILHSANPVSWIKSTFAESSHLIKKYHLYEAMAEGNNYQNLLSEPSKRWGISPNNILKYFPDWALSRDIEESRSIQPEDRILEYIARVKNAKSAEEWWLECAWLRHI
jgi:hypothetical protein